MTFSKVLSLPGQNKENVTTRSSLHVNVCTLAPCTIAYFRHVGPYKGDTALFRQLFEKLFAWAGPRGLLGADMKYLSLMQDNPSLTPIAKQRLEVALVVSKGTTPSGEIGVKTFDGGLYATSFT